MYVHHQKPIVKHSYGIALLNEKYGDIKMLLIKKRCSYHFCNFVMGKYDRNDVDKIKRMFDYMTVSEKIVIMSMNFELIWYKIWLFDTVQRTGPEKIYNPNAFSGGDDEIFTKCKNKFIKNFVNNPKININELIKSSGSIEGIWEIPKGRKNKDEKGLDCAIREFEEEVCIDSSQYTILRYEPIKFTHEDEKVIYHKYIYFAKLTDTKWAPQVSFMRYSFINEVEDIRWFSLMDIASLKSIPKIVDHLVYQYNTVISQYKTYYGISNRQEKQKCSSAANKLEPIEIMFTRPLQKGTT